MIRAAVSRAITWLAGLVILLAAGCAQPVLEVPVHADSATYRVDRPGDEGEADGLGGTGVLAREDGLGGTGMHVGDEADGLGGTGVIGPITGFGSIIVNGLGIDYPDDVAVELNGDPATGAALRIGQVVELRAGDTDGKVSTRRIVILDAAVGPVEHLDVDRGTLRVLGQTIHIDDTTAWSTELRSGGLNDVRIGTALRVSGLRLGNGEVVATRLDLPRPGADWSVAGPITRISGKRFYIGGLQLVTQDPRELHSGRPVLVRGDTVGGRFQIRDIRFRPGVPFAGRVERLLVQGYADLTTSRNALRLGQMTIALPHALRVDQAGRALTPGSQRVQVNARLDRGRIAAKELRVIRPAPRPVTDRPVRGSKPIDAHGQSNGRSGLEPIERSVRPIRPQLELPSRPEPVIRPERPVPVDRPILNKVDRVFSR